MYYFPVCRINIAAGRKFDPLRRDERGERKEERREKREERRQKREEKIDI